MEDEWGKPIELPAPISIDQDGCVVIGNYAGATTITHREDGRKSQIHSVDLLSGYVLPNGSPTMAIRDECRFWGSYDLDEKLRRVVVGQKVRIAYVGTDKLSGGREMKIFEVRPAVMSQEDERNPPPPETAF